MVRLLPGNIIDIMFGGDATATPEAEGGGAKQLGLDGSYLDAVLALGQRDLPRRLRQLAARNSSPISDIVATALPITVELIILGLLIAVVIGDPARRHLGRRARQRSDYAARVGGLIGISIPNFWLATLLLLFTSRVFHWVPPLTYVPFYEDPMENLQRVHPAGDLDLRLHARDRDAHGARDDARGARAGLRPHGAREGRAAAGA